MPSEAFIPGAFWTPERAREAARAMVAAYESPEMQAVLAQFDGGPPPPPPPPAEPVRKLDIALADYVLRRGTPADTPRLAQLIAEANLPPLFIEQFVEGFCVAEQGGEIIAGGGVEVYGPTAVIRSVFVDPRAQGIGLGGHVSRLLIEDAKKSGAADLYLFTADAHPFWLRLGFVDVSLDDWLEPPRVGWQYWFLNARRHFMSELHSMWKRV